MTDVSRGGRRVRVDPDELARLEEERDFLLRSIDDLDHEHEAGDVDPDDYAELRDGYVARAAAAIHALEDQQTTLAASQASAPRHRGHAVAWVAAVVVFAGVAGVLLANASGSRGSAGLTGSGVMPGEDTERCRTLSFHEPAKGVVCYEKLLVERPDDVDALTYLGWAMVRSGDVAGGSANFDRVVQLEPDFPDVRVFRASVAKDAGDFIGAQAELDTLYALNPSPVVLSTLQQLGLDREIAIGLLPDDVAECWNLQDAALGAVDEATNVASADDLDREALAAAFADLAVAVGCLDDIAEVRPDDLDNLMLRSLAVGLLGVLDDSAVPRAVQNVDRVLELRPDDPTALLLRAVWRFRLDDLDGAAADLDALGDRRVSPLIGGYVDRAQVAAELEAARASAAVSTSVPRSTTTSQ